MSEAKEAILARIRAARAGQAEETLQQTVAKSPSGGSYRRSLGLDRDALVALFAERIADYDVGVRYAGAGELADALAGGLGGFSGMLDHGVERGGVGGGHVRSCGCVVVQMIERQGISPCLLGDIWDRYGALQHEFVRCGKKY